MDQLKRFLEQKIVSLSRDMYKSVEYLTVGSVIKLINGEYGLILRIIYNSDTVRDLEMIAKNSENFNKENAELFVTNLKWINGNVLIFDLIRKTKRIILRDVELKLVSDYESNRITITGDVSQLLLTKRYKNSF